MVKDRCSLYSIQFKHDNCLDFQGPPSAPFHNEWGWLRHKGVRSAYGPLCMQRAICYISSCSHCCLFHLWFCSFCSTSGQSLYDVLGLPKTCTQDDIKKAYRKVSECSQFFNNPSRMSHLIYIYIYIL